MVGVIAHNLLFRQVVSLSKVAAFFAYVGLVLATAPLVARYLKAS